MIRRFSEQSNETAGHHFTPRDVVRLMVNLLFIEDNDILTKPGIIKTLFEALNQRETIVMTIRIVNLFAFRSTEGC